LKKGELGGFALGRLGKIPPHPPLERGESYLRISSKCCYVVIVSTFDLLSVNSANQSRDSGIDSVPFAESILSEAEGLRASTNSFPHNDTAFNALI